MTQKSNWLTALEHIIPLLGAHEYHDLKVELVSMTPRPGPVNEGGDTIVELVIVLDVELDVILDDETDHVLMLFTWNKTASSGITVHSDCQPSDSVMENLVELGRQIQLGLDKLPDSIVPTICLP